MHLDRGDHDSRGGGERGKIILLAMVYICIYI